MIASFCLFLFASAAAPAATDTTPALQTTATVNVLVTDRRGRALRSARVAVNGSEYKGVTDSKGRVVFRNMKIGSYVLRVERDTFITFEKDFEVREQTLPISVVAAISPAASLAARPSRAPASARRAVGPASAR